MLIHLAETYDAEHKKMQGSWGMFSRNIREHVR